METHVISLDEDWQSPAQAVLRAGGLVALPTETVYGLAGDATHADAVAAIYAAKGRPAHNPLIAHMHDLSMAERYVTFSDAARKLAQAFWPGPLTMVLPSKTAQDLAPAVTAGGAALAVRCPCGPLGDMAGLLGRPLAAPSANRSGHISPTSAQHVMEDLRGRIALIVDGGSCAQGVESTILDMREGRAPSPALLRPGSLTQEAIEETLGAKLHVPHVMQDAPVAPGQLASHYAPAMTVRLNVLAKDVHLDEAYIGFGSHRADQGLTLSSRGDLEEAARTLYAALRQAEASGPRAIAVAPIPQEGLGQAINDRLRRAAAPR